MHISDYFLEIEEYKKQHQRSEKTQKAHDVQKIVTLFRDEINKEWKAAGWKYYCDKTKRWKKLYPAKYIAVRQLMAAIVDDLHTLRWFWAKCKSEQRRTKRVVVDGHEKFIKGSFSKTFYGMLK